MISEKEELLEWRKRAAAQPAGRVVLDLEADSLHRYQEKICLIQYADETGSCLIDPLSIEDMGPFYNWLKETEVWMHGADYDMSLFQHAWETLPAMIWDTQTAARLLGFRQFGLAALVEHFYGITLSKSSQKADWARRPLSPTMVTYALNDVNYMLDMADKLTAALREKGRMGWFEEICRHSMERARERHLAGKYTVLINVPISIASAMAASSVPALTAAYAAGKKGEAKRQIGIATRFIMVIAFPCAVGMGIQRGRAFG